MIEASGPGQSERNTYGEALEVTAKFLEKMRTEGWRSRRAQMVVPETGLRVGEAYIEANQ